jgi:hypothetical protein
MRSGGTGDRRLAVLAHGAGLLGLTVAGWLLAAAVSFGLVLLAGRRRSLYLAVHAGQAALFQLTVFTAQVVYLFWLGAGFLSFGGAIPGVENWRFFDELPDPWLTGLEVVWGLSLLLWPVFSLGAVALSAIGAWHVAHDRPFWYPLVSRRVQRLSAGPPAQPAGPPAGHPPEPLPAGPARLGPEDAGPTSDTAPDADAPDAPDPEEAGGVRRRSRARQDWEGPGGPEAPV